MNDEALRIQRMVAEGKITPEESVELLESIAPSRSAIPPPLPPQADLVPDDEGQMGLLQRLARFCWGASVAQRYPIASALGGLAIGLGLLYFGVFFAYEFPVPALLIALIIVGASWYRQATLSLWVKVLMLVGVFLIFLFGLTLSSRSPLVPEEAHVRAASINVPAPVLQKSYLLSKSSSSNQDALFGRLLNALSTFAATYKRYPVSLSQLSSYLDQSDIENVSGRVWYSCAAQPNSIPTLKVLDINWRAKHGEQIQLPKLEDDHTAEPGRDLNLPAEQGQ